ncbi:MAG: Holliday junction branch migration protein RuvA [Bacteroidales bacterium]|nr:Holliday junction branch migration protein RuvA [Bacteroidales bacterium]
MFEYIEGKLVSVSPTNAIIETSGIGFLIEISVQTYSQIQHCLNSNIKLYTQLIVKEDSLQMFGFYKKEEKEIFNLLISVNGIGANTARTILSSASLEDIITSISTGNIEEFKKIKGIGQKTAERIMVELRDKFTKYYPAHSITTTIHNKIKEDALSALIMLGYSKSIAEKIVNKILSENKNITTEDLIKLALKMM